MSDSKIKLSLRIPRTLDESLKVSAEKLGISKNSYITMLLSKSQEKEN